MENYAERTGRGLFIRFLEEQPDAKAVFGFANATGKNSNADSVYETRQFLAVAKNFIEIVDQAVDMLGPDLEVLAEVLIELGEKYHNEYGMRSEYYPVLGRALIDQLEEMMGPEQFGIHTKSCWLQVYGALSAVMEELNIPAAKTESIPSPKEKGLEKRKYGCCPKRRT